VTAITGWARCRPPGQAYEERRAPLLGEVNAALDGALAAGTTEMVCDDSPMALITGDEVTSAEEEPFLR
jgi:D-aminopeptidase